MDDAVRQTLMQLCDELGVSLLQDPERLEAHLRDLIPGRNAEIHCLSMAVREGVVSDLLSASDALPTDVLVARLSDRLHERMAMDPAAARWAVESLAQAVGRPHAGAPAKVALGTALAPRVEGRPAGSASALARAAEAIDARWACTACRQLNHRDLRFCGYCGASRAGQAPAPGAAPPASNVVTPRRPAAASAAEPSSAASRPAPVSASSVLAPVSDRPPPPAPPRGSIVPSPHGGGQVVPKPHGRRRTAWLAVAVGIVAVLAVAGVVWAVTSGDSGQGGGAETFASPASDEQIAVGDSGQGESAGTSAAPSPSEQIAIGDPYQGGIVAYILQPGDPGYVDGETHGLIAATADQGSMVSWGNLSARVPGAVGTAIGTGLINTNARIARTGASARWAAGLARRYSGGGYTDWYLPSKDELSKLYLNSEAIGGFASENYWSSSMHEALYAWCQYFADGTQRIDQGEYTTNCVRAVRAF